MLDSNPPKLQRDDAWMGWLVEPLNPTKEVPQGISRMQLPCNHTTGPL